MAIFTINKGSSDYSVDSSSIVTDCSSSFFFDVDAAQGDLINISISGDHSSEYYTSNGVKNSFSDTQSGIVFDNSLLISFFLKNSGDSGEFFEATVIITNTSSSNANKSFTERVIRENDNLDCDFVGLTADPGAQDNQVAVFTSDNSIEGTPNLTYDGLKLDVSGRIIGSSVEIDGGLFNQFLMADGSVSTVAPGGGGDDLNYTHDQGTPSVFWTINHGLGKNPSVSAVDTAGTVVTGDVDYIDLNTLTISFNDPFAGYAYIN